MSEVEQAVVQNRNEELRDLIRRVSGGDEDALKMLYKNTIGLVYGMSKRIVSDSSEAEEVALEVYMQVWRGASTYEPEQGNPMTWLLMITRSRAIDRLRKSSRARRQL